MPPLMKRIEGEVLKEKQRAKNRKREHGDHGWVVERDFDNLLEIVFMRCPCGWSGWMPREGV